MPDEGAHYRDLIKHPLSFHAAAAHGRPGAGLTQNFDLAPFSDRNRGPRQGGSDGEIRAGPRAGDLGGVGPAAEILHGHRIEHRKVRAGRLRHQGGDDQTGDAKSACVKQAKADEDKGKADIKAMAKK